jgi:hypothetical protein
MECGGKRSATPLWIWETLANMNPKRRRAALAAALHSYLATALQSSHLSEYVVTLNRSEVLQSRAVFDYQRATP